jgi:uncharacterized phage protein (TIGR01671 family)
MMEIKFRAWDIERKQMGEVEEIIWGSTHLWRENIALEVWAMGRVYYLENNSKILKLLQFTGQYDKNGTPIYVGDKLKITHKSEPESQVSTVTFEDGIFGIVGEFIGEDGQDYSYFAFACLKGANYEYEVIGNTWQDKASFSYGKWC